MDCNAISVNVNLNGELAQIGYVPCGRIRQMTQALVDDNIVEANLVVSQVPGTSSSEVTRTSSSEVPVQKS